MEILKQLIPQNSLLDTTTSRYCSFEFFTHFGFESVSSYIIYHKYGTSMSIHFCYLISTLLSFLHCMIKILRQMKKLPVESMNHTLQHNPSLRQSKYRVCQKKLDQNKMTINFYFAIDIIFMNSFLILMFFEEGLTKQFRCHLTST